jgi:CRISPR-associated protein Cas1
VGIVDPDEIIEAGLPPVGSRRQTLTTKEGLAPMAASFTVPQVSSADNFPRTITPELRNGVLTVFGYGIRVHVDRGHLIVEDGIGPHRRRCRLARIGHNLRRLVVIGSDGMVSLAAIRWLAEKKAGFVMLNRNGSVLLATGPAGPRDARLRRAQALAHHSGVATVIARDLIDRKLRAQEHTVRNVFNDAGSASAIAAVRARLQSAEHVDRIRLFEAHAAVVYWNCWRAIPVRFPDADLPRVPEHWRTFDTRASPLTGSSRLATNPPNAILNYLYAVLESEARLAATALGLDAALGVLHTDTHARDSLACDLMEPVRPAVDAHVLDWLLQGSLRRNWFFEERNGACRLMGSFVERLSATAPTWAQAIGPIAERLVQTLWSAVPTSTRRTGSKTPLTQRLRREAHGAGLAPIKRPPRPPRLCRRCGTELTASGVHCGACVVRIREAATQRKHERAERLKERSDVPSWLTADVFLDRVQPHLREKTTREIASLLGVSKWYAMDIRLGRCLPHRRHWQTLARLTGVSAESTVAPADPSRATNSDQ